MGQLALGEDDGEVPAPRLDDEAGDISNEESEAAFAEAYEDEEIDHDMAVPDVAGPSSQQRKKRHERRRVPSWDEIMFGGKPEGQ